MDNSTAAHLDSGAMQLFAEQIADALGNVIAVAVHDLGGKLIWAGPESRSKSFWTVNPFLRAAVPGDGFVERLSNKNYVYVFYLNYGEDETQYGTLSVQIDSSNPVSLEYAQKEVAPILACIERQIGINVELSAVRRVTAEGQKGMQLLMQLDELDNDSGPREILRHILRLSAAHFDAELTAVLLPGFGIQEIWPEEVQSDEEISKAVITTLGGLVSQAQIHRQVLLSGVNIKARSAVAFQSNDPKILCSPIINSIGDVIGVFVLMASHDYSKEQVRLSRAICAKINMLLRTADQMRNEHHSRHSFLQHTSAVIGRSSSQSHAVLYVDIDKLHIVNDNFGHVAGDQVIRFVSEQLDDLCGSEDIIAHLHGDAFCLFLRECDENKAHKKAEMLLESIARTDIEYEGRIINVNASAGIAMIPDVVADASAALNTAEVAARSAKSRGGGRTVVFRDLDASVAQRRSDLDQVGHLQAALIENRFVLYAQAIKPLHDEENVHRYEILVRMLDEKGVALPPGAFMSAAERYQMMSALDRWVVRNALDRLANAENLLEISLGSFSINISAQSLADDDFPAFLEHQIVESGVSPDSLCFEITETSIVRNLERAQRCIRRLRKLGCRLALDDFGTGYCSFAHLKDLPVQYLKIDGVFVRDMLENPLSEAIIASAVNIAKVMNAATIAEHVENDLLTHRLRHQGVDFVQGFAIGKPAPFDEVLTNIGPPVLLGELKNTAS
ncbi:MAG: EAL domain-containing protein [Gammaproteobacteria bacterium]|nr:EAL domain-containing protein [Gammaproteobacteria bacterium]